MTEQPIKSRLARPGAAATSKPKAGIYARGLEIQGKVIGALLMRELHTRYGRDNVGYLWLFGEPLLLASAVGLLHSRHSGTNATGVSLLPLGVLGYCMFIIFRGMISRAEGTLEANMPLLYHRSVTIFDMMLARAILEGISCFVTYMILISLLTAFDLATLPYRPGDFLFGVFQIFWWSWSISMIVCAITHDRRVVARLVHPVVYILMPLSGGFFQLVWLPEPYRTYMSWFPMVDIFEQLRYGQFADARNDYTANTYVVAVCTILTYIGLVLIKRVRRRVHLH